MADRLRFHLDEHVDSIIAKALRRHGIDVTTTVEASLLGRSDEIHFDHAKTSGRVIVTHDADFLRLARRTSEHSGIVYCHLTAHTSSEIIRKLILTYEILTADEIRGRVEFL